VAETHGDALRRWLLTAVRDLGGAAPRALVHERVEQLFGPEFTSADRTPRVGRGQEEAWRNNLDSLYDRLKKRGEMVSAGARAPWQLSESAAAEARSLPLVVTSESDLLAHFKPKNGDEYVAHLSGRVLRKERLHESLLGRYGRAMAARGWQPVTTVHPRDLELRRAGERWVVEVKVVYNGNGTEATRAALAQLLEYRHFFYPGSGRPGMLAVFSEAIGAAHVALLDTLDISAAWASGSEWGGSHRAVAAELVP